MRYIPKTIHLIWYGGNPYSPIVKRCIASWERHCPDYEIMLWDEEHFDVGGNAFAREAYEAKKWAFVSDYVRLYALYHYGGVYIDSDVEVVKGFDHLLEGEHAVTGYSAKGWLTTGFMAAEKENPWIGELLDYYSDRHFILPGGKYDMKPNNAVITELSKRKNGFKVGDLSIAYGNVRLYPRVYFHPYKRQVFDFNEENMEDLGRYFNTDEERTYCIHYSMGSWGDQKKTPLTRLKHWVRKVSPQAFVEWLESIYYRKFTWRGLD